MQGYRTILFAVVNMLAGLAVIFGVEFSEETKAALIENSEAVIGGGMALYGLVTGLLRAVTKTPVGERD